MYRMSFQHVYYFFALLHLHHSFPKKLFLPKTPYFHTVNICIHLQHCTSHPSFFYWIVVVIWERNTKESEWMKISWREKRKDVQGRIWEWKDPRVSDMTGAGERERERAPDTKTWWHFHRNKSDTLFPSHSKQMERRWNNLWYTVCIIVESYLLASYLAKGTWEAKEWESRRKWENRRKWERRREWENRREWVGRKIQCEEREVSDGEVKENSTWEKGSQLDLHCLVTSIPLHYCIGDKECMNEEAPVLLVVNYKSSTHMYMYIYIRMRAISLISNWTRTNNSANINNALGNRMTRNSLIHWFCYHQRRRLGEEKKISHLEDPARTVIVIELSWVEVKCNTKSMRERKKNDHLTWKLWLVKQKQKQKQKGMGSSHTIGSK